MKETTFLIWFDEKVRRMKILYIKIIIIPSCINYLTWKYNSFFKGSHHVIIYKYERNENLIY